MQEDSKQSEGSRVNQVNSMMRNNFSVPLFLGLVVAGSLIAGAILYTGGVFNRTSLGTPAPNVQNGSNAPGSKVQGADQAEKRLNLASTIGLDKEKFKACVEKADKSEVTNDVDDLTRTFTEYNKKLSDPRDGLGGTPTFIIGKVVEGNMVEGQALVGAQPFEIFDEVLDSWVNKGEKKIIEGQTNDTVIKIAIDDDPVLGNKDAQIAMVEASDYECPFCKRYFQQAFQEINKKYVEPGKLKIVYRDFPLPIHNPMATDVAVAANCAREQGGDEKYYEYHDTYFTNTQANAQGL